MRSMGADMSENINVVIFAGNLVSDCTRRVSGNGITRLLFRIASSGYNAKTGEQWTTFANCVVFGDRRCASLEPFLFRGAHVTVQGIWHTQPNRQQTAEGRYIDPVEILVKNIEIDQPETDDEDEYALTEDDLADNEGDDGSEGRG